MKMKQLLVTALLALVTLGTFSPTAHSDWTSFRAGGSSHVSGELPTRWSPHEGIAWQLELPGYGQSTPVIFRDYVYVTAVEGTMKEACLVLCYELSSGQELWRLTLKSANPSPSNYMASRAAPTPVVDERGLYAFFETGDVVAVNLHGEKLWHRELTADYGHFDNNHGLGASPAQNATHLFLNIEHRGPSYLIAIDKFSGATTWKVDRGSGSSWSSPIVADVNGDEQVIVSSGGSVAGYNVEDGSQLWLLDGLQGNTVPSPTMMNSKLFIGARLPEFAAEGSVRSNCCIDLSRLGADGPQVLWRAEKAMSDYCSPVQAGAVTYFVNKGGVLYCIDSQSGKLHYVKRLGSV
jgi:outer membrane protein assembly factor BamB